MTGLVEIVAGWPLAASLVVAVTARGLWAGRRRTALNEALHELRRPLQSIALATGPEDRPRVESSVQLAAVALDRLDREINGRIPQQVRDVVLVRPLLESAVGRCKARASLAGASLELRWHAGDALVEADRCGLAQAFDNLIVNAIEHGGPAIVVEAWPRRGRLRVTVADSGRASLPDSRGGTPTEVIARLRGRRRHGHGLAVVRRVATVHGGRFALQHEERGSRAVLELPLASSGAGPAV